MLEDTRGLESCPQEASGALELGCLRHKVGGSSGLRGLEVDCSKLSDQGWREVEHQASACTTLVEGGRPSQQSKPRGPCAFSQLPLPSGSTLQLASWVRPHRVLLLVGFSTRLGPGFLEGAVFTRSISYLSGSLSTLVF